MLQISRKIPFSVCQTICLYSPELQRHCGRPLSLIKQSFFIFYFLLESKAIQTVTDSTSYNSASTLDRSVSVRGNNGSHVRSTRALTLSCVCYRMYSITKRPLTTTGLASVLHDVGSANRATSLILPFNPQPTVPAFRSLASAAKKSLPRPRLNCQICRTKKASTKASTKVTAV